MGIRIISFPEDYFQVLQTCLDRLVEGDQTIDSLLLLYPRLRDQLLPPLEAAAWLNSRKGLLNPRPEFIPASRNHIVTYLNTAVQTNPSRVRKTRGRKPRLVIWKNAVFFSIFGPLLTSLFK